MKKIYLSPPHISKKEIREVKHALKSGWISPFGSYQKDFTHSLSEYFNANTLLTNNGTSAIHLALMGCNIQPDDYVLCSNFTFAASAFPILYQKAKPVFIGIERNTWNISPEFLVEAIKNLKQKNITPKALVIAYCYGNPAQWEDIKKICVENNISIIEDAAEALGSTYESTPLGALGEYGTLSFNGNKIITCSIGGALVTKKNLQFLEKTAYQAKENLPYYHHESIGYNYAQSNILSALGVVQFQKLSKRVKKRKRNFEFYYTQLKEIIEYYQQELPDSISNRWLSTFVFKDLNGIDVITKLNQNNIESRRLWKPMTQQPVFSDAMYFGDNFENVLFEKGICLPSGSNLELQDLENIVSIIKSFK